MPRRVLRVERSVSIARPDWEVFTFLADAENEVLWRPKVLHVRKTYAGPMGLGAAYWRVDKGLLGRKTGIVRVTAYEADRAVTFAGSFDGGAQPTDEYRVTPTPDGAETRVDAAYETPLGHLGALAAGHLSVKRARELADNLARLKRLLEDPARTDAIMDAAWGERPA
ncbi:MAG: SRPBCC family protein [Chloroflexota bacterium]|nr:SRPBCC family protein [Chloroflexota bacterium]